MTKKSAKETIKRFISQAKESMKLLDTLQQEAFSRVKTLLQSEDVKKITREQIVKRLKKMGLATHSEVRDVEKKLEDLASEFRSQLARINRKTSKKEGKHETETSV